MRRLLQRMLSALVSAGNVPVVRLVVALVVVWAAASLVYGYWARRTAVVEARASTAQIELDEDLRPLALGPYDLCLPIPPDPRKAGPSVHGCAPDLFNIGTYDEPSLPFPKGAVVEFRVTAGRFEVEAVKLPQRWHEEEYGFGEGAIFSVEAGRLSEFGQLIASGFVSIGAVPGVDKGPLHSGRYRLYGKTLTGFLLPQIGNVILAEADLPPGAFLTFARALSGDRVPANLQLSAPGSGDERGLALLAISKTSNVDLKMELFQTEPILLRPDFTDTLLKDPLLFVVFTILSAVLSTLTAARDLFAVKGNPGPDGSAASTEAIGRSREDPEG